MGQKREHDSELVAAIEIIHVFVATVVVVVAMCQHGRGTQSRIERVREKSDNGKSTFWGKLMPLRRRLMMIHAWLGVCDGLKG